MSNLQIIDLINKSMNLLYLFFMNLTQHHTYNGYIFACISLFFNKAINKKLDKGVRSL